MKTKCYLLFVFVFAFCMLTPSTSFADEEETPPVEVIIQTDGPPDAVASIIRSLGGTVRFRYQNVPAVAVTIPASRLTEVSELTQVIKVEKDRMVYLHDSLNPEEEPEYPMVFFVDDIEGVQVQPIEPMTINPGILPEGFANYSFTGAYKIWKETNYGKGSIVAIVDTGTVPNTCLSHAVIGAPGYPNGYNATNDGIPATDPRNIYHGTFVGGEVASSCSISFSDPNHIFYQSISPYLPWGPDFIPILGQAPAAKIYPVKVFSAKGGSTPTSVILNGLDHILTLKKERLLDIDIVNMSLGGPTSADGLDAFDRFIEELVKAGMLVVTSAGNNGPAPNTIGSPATSYLSLAVGALDYAPTTRVLYEFRVLRDGIESPGLGLTLRHTDETRVAYFSSRGPLSDGRAGPDIAALGQGNLLTGPNNEIGMASGTSFAAPTVAGAAALLSAYWKSSVQELNPLVLHTALLAGANPDVVGAEWSDINDQGWGALDVARALELLKQRPKIPSTRRGQLPEASALKDPKNALIEPWLREFVVRMLGQRRASIADRWIDLLNPRSGFLKSNTLPNAVQGTIDTWESEVITLAPGEERDLIFEIDEYTSTVSIYGYEISMIDNSDSFLQGGSEYENGLRVYIQTAKRTDLGYFYSFRHAAYWTDAFYVEMRDENGLLYHCLPAPSEPPAVDPTCSDQFFRVMDTGLMKLTFTTRPWNHDPISLKVRITRENLREPLTNPDASGEINAGDSVMIPIEIPEGVAKAWFDLDWMMKWNKFPSNDLDMVIVGPGPYYGAFTFWGATDNAPERSVVWFPLAGTWQVYIYGRELYTPDYYQLFLRLEK